MALTLYYRDSKGVMRALDGIKILERKWLTIFIDKSVYNLPSGGSGIEANPTESGYYFRRNADE